MKIYTAESLPVQRSLDDWRKSVDRDALALRHRFRRVRFIASCLFAISIGMVLVGCGTTTTRLATEQLLMSDAVDRAISEIDFRHLEGKKVYLDTLFLHSVKGVGFVNSEYIISSLRHQLTASQAMIQDSRETAEVIVEPRVGALGTDGHEMVYGIPQTGAINSAAAIFSSSAIPAIPEISFGKSNAQSGIAKIIVYAYDRESRLPVWQSGVAKAESTSRDTWVLGAGPFQKGSIHDRVRFAGKDLPPAQLPNPHFAAEWRHAEVADPDLAEPEIPAEVAEQVEPQPSVSYGDPFVFTSPWDEIGELQINPPPKPDQGTEELNAISDKQVVPASHEDKK